MPTPEPIPAQIRTLAQRAANGTWVGAGDLTPIAAELERGSTYDRVMAVGRACDAAGGEWYSSGGLRIYQPRHNVWDARWGTLGGGWAASEAEAMKRLLGVLIERGRFLLDLPAQWEAEPEASAALEDLLRRVAA